jgi:hypothetical protein
MRMTPFIGVFGLLAVVGAGPAYGQSLGTPVFSSLPDSTPANVASLGFQCCATRELGDEIILEANTPRRAGSATVLMSSWSQHSSYPALPAEGYTHPITLNIYEDAAAALAHAPVRSITRLFTIPWRPAASLSCPGAAWMSATDGLCYNGLAFEIEFDLRSLNYDLPSQFIYGVTFNTHMSGYQPLGVAGPYDSLNIGFSPALSPSIGQDVDADVVYWNTTMAPWYSDGGAGGAGTFRADTGWTGLLVGVKFTTSAVPVTSSDCKYGGWQNLVRADFSAFVNQGACVSYVNSQP